MGSPVLVSGGDQVDGGHRKAFLIPLTFKEAFLSLDIRLDLGRHFKIIKSAKWPATGQMDKSPANVREDQACLARVSGSWQSPKTLGLYWVTGLSADMPNRLLR